MTKAQYLEMCEQTGEEIDWDRCPEDWEDFPPFIVDYFNLYHSLGDRIYPDVGYVGKDFTNFEFFIEQYGIEDHQKDLLIEFILWMESRRIQESQRKIKEAMDKVKRKSG